MHETCKQIHDEPSHISHPYTRFSVRNMLVLSSLIHNPGPSRIDIRSFPTYSMTGHTTRTSRAADSGDVRVEAKTLKHLHICYRKLAQHGLKQLCDAFILRLGALALVARD